MKEAEKKEFDPLEDIEEEKEYKSKWSKHSDDKNKIITEWLQPKFMKKDNKDKKDRHERNEGENEYWYKFIKIK